MSNRDENRGGLLGFCAALVVVGFVQVVGMMEGDSDDIHLRHIEQALVVCENNGGLHMIDGEIFLMHKFRCRNGAVFTYDSNRDADIAFDTYTQPQVIYDYCLRDYEGTRTKEQADHCAKLYTEEVFEEREDHDND